MRLYSQKAGLFTWNKPAYACLATRIPCGMPIDAETLCRIESAEEALSRMGFSDFRVRITQDLSAKIQINKAQMDLFMASREKMLRELENDFDNILLDLRLRGE